MQTSQGDKGNVFKSRIKIPRENTMSQNIGRDAIKNRPTALKN